MNSIRSALPVLASVDGGTLAAVAMIVPMLVAAFVIAPTMCKSVPVVGGDPPSLVLVILMRCVIGFMIAVLVGGLIASL